MAQTTYHTGIDSDDRSVKSATKLWTIVLALVVLLGIALITTFLLWRGEATSGGISSENTSSRPAEP